MRDTAEESGMRCGVQRRAAEDIEWRAGKKSRWKMIHAKRGCGERVRESSEAPLKATDRGGGRRRRNKMIQKTTETGGAGRVKLLKSDRV